MKKHFLKCCSIKDACKKTDSQGSKSKSAGQWRSLAASPRRTRVTSAVVMRRKATSQVGQSPKLVAKQPLKEQVQESLHHSKCLAGSSSEGGHHWSHKKSKKHSKKSHKKLSLVPDVGMFDFFQFSMFVVNKVHCEPFVGSSCLFCILVHCTTGSCVVCFVSIGIK